MKKQKQRSGSGSKRFIDFLIDFENEQSEKKLYLSIDMEVWIIFDIWKY